MNSLIHHSKSALVAAALVISAAASSPANAQEQLLPRFQFAGYMRAGTGWNIEGGKQTCFNNPGTLANEFRLGNECSIYGEASLRTYFTPAVNPKDPYFRSQLTFAYFPPADSQYEDSDLDADRRDINVVEAFVEGGNLEGRRMNFWAGKRFYRHVDIHMNDFYFYADMSGNGGGISGIDTGAGLLSIAVLRESALTAANLATNTPASRIAGQDAGVLGKTALDVRLDKIPLGDSGLLHTWVAAAYTPPGFDGTTTYQSGSGLAVGALHRQLMGEAAFNDIAVIYGNGVMQSLNLSGSTIVSAASSLNDANRLRIVDHFVMPWTPQFSTEFAAMYEARDDGSAVDPKSTWWNVGVRPAYFVTENFHLVGELGHSRVKSESDRDVTGANGISARTLTRITFAPQVGFKSALFARPVIRFFVSHSVWNDDNKSFQMNGAPASITNLPAFANENSGTSLGFQSEVWF